MDVETILEAQDRATGPLKAVERAAGSTSHTIAGTERATEALNRSFESLKVHAEVLGASLGVGLGLREFKEMFVDTNSQIEDATRALGGMVAGLYQFTGATTPAQNLARAMERSKEMMEGFEESATRTGIPARTLAVAAQQLAPGMAQTRTSTKELVGFTNKLAILSKMVGAETMNSAMAMNMFVQYGMSERNPLMMQLGLHGQIYAKMTAAQRLSLVQKKLDAFGISEETMRQHETLSDKMGRIHAQMELIAERAGKPLFDRASEEAGKLADWLDKNQDKVKAIEGEVVDKLVRGFNLAVDGARYLADHLEQVKTSIEAIAIAWTSIKVGKAMAGFGTGFKTIAENAGGSFAQAAGSKLQTFLGGAGMLAQAAGIGWAVGTAIDGYLQQTGWWKQLWTPQESLTEQAQDKTIQYGKDVSQALGTMSMDELLAAQDKIARAGKADLAVAIGPAGKGLFAHAGEISNAIEQLAMRPKIPAPPAGPKMPGDRGRDQMQQNFYNSRFDISQQFAPGFDPDRVAVAFTADLSALGDKRMQSTLHPLHVAT